jgi:pyruvate/2-oxoglutarate dehydrogenase complex dihydrolipoamide dehydrogenase (E3) component
VPVVPRIPGLDEKGYVFAQEAIAGEAKLGKNVVVIGGGEVGMETGMYLANQGHEVTVLEMRDELAADTTLIHYRSMFVEAWESIRMLRPVTGARVTKVEGDAVVYTDEDNAEHSVSADSVVVAVGMKAKSDEALSYYGAADRFFLIGDCAKPATLHEAMRSAFAAAGSL